MATELKAQLSNNKIGRSVKLLAQLRELTPFLQDQAVFSDDYLSMIYPLINQVKHLSVPRVAVLLRCDIESSMICSDRSRTVIMTAARRFGSCIIT